MFFIKFEMYDLYRTREKQAPQDDTPQKDINTTSDQIIYDISYVNSNSIQIEVSSLLKRKNIFFTVFSSIKKLYSFRY